MREEDSKSPETNFSGDVVGSLTMLLTEVDDETELSPESPMKEEKIEEIMQELYKELTCSSSSNVSPTSPLSSFPSPLSSPSSSLSSSSLLPFDGKSESCGASVSDSGSTVMAGIEFVGPTGCMTKGKVGLSGNGEWTVGIGCHGGGEGEGCDLMEEDGDEWLARVLGWGPPVELEDWK
ncbi:hypothetical protein Patl1_13025 [Pistacia atlantica]|uniref:Uncharacterized protein n=1 Tax=Pistacia atlantica TaxID=434234 RepID=A0ACC1AWY4_9ROSI|nr:hypothetical protein Patl1_13025 [Pistacia atlantica]